MSMKPLLAALRWLSKLFGSRGKEIEDARTVNDITRISYDELLKEWKSMSEKWEDRFNKCESVHKETLTEVYELRIENAELRNYVFDLRDSQQSGIELPKSQGDI